MYRCSVLTEEEDKPTPSSNIQAECGTEEKKAGRMPAYPQAYPHKKKE